MISTSSPARRSAKSIFSPSSVILHSASTGKEIGVVLPCRRDVDGPRVEMHLANHAAQADDAMRIDLQQLGIVGKGDFIAGLQVGRLVKLTALVLDIAVERDFAVFRDRQREQVRFFGRADVDLDESFCRG